MKKTFLKNGFILRNNNLWSQILSFLPQIYNLFKIIIFSFLFTLLFTPIKNIYSFFFSEKNILNRIYECIYSFAFVEEEETLLENLENKVSILDSQNSVLINKLNKIEDSILEQQEGVNWTFPSLVEKVTSSFSDSSFFDHWGTSIFNICLSFLVGYIINFIFSYAFSSDPSEGIRLQIAAVDRRIHERIDASQQHTEAMVSVSNQQMGAVLCDVIDLHDKTMGDSLRTNTNYLGNYIENVANSINDQVTVLDEKILNNQQSIELLRNQQETILEQLSEISTLLYFIYQNTESLAMEEIPISLEPESSAREVSEEEFKQSSSVVDVDCESDCERVPCQIPSFIPLNAEENHSLMPSTNVGAVSAVLAFRENTAYRENPAAFFSLDPVRLVAYRNALIELEHSLPEIPVREELNPVTFAPGAPRIIKFFSLLGSLTSSLVNNPFVSRALVSVGSSLAVGFLKSWVVPSTVSYVIPAISNEISHQFNSLFTSTGNSEIIIEEMEVSSSFSTPIAPVLNPIAISALMGRNLNQEMQIIAIDGNFLLHFFDTLNTF